MIPILRTLSCPGHAGSEQLPAQSRGGHTFLRELFLYLFYAVGGGRVVCDRRASLGVARLGTARLGGRGSGRDPQDSLDLSEPNQCWHAAAWNVNTPTLGLPGQPGLPGHCQA